MSMLQHDKVSGYTLGIRFRPMAESDFYLYSNCVPKLLCTQISMACTKIPMAYLETSPHAQDPAKCISLFYASHVLKYCTVHNMQAQREYHIVIIFN